MFIRVRNKLTFLCIALITLVLTVITIIYLMVSESALRDSQRISFENNMNTLSSSLSGQSLITRDMLFTLSFGQKYQIYLLDNGIPLWSSNPSGQENTTALFSEMLDAYEDIYATRTDNGGGLVYLVYPAVFTFDSFVTGGRYYAYFNMPKQEKSSLTALVLFPLSLLEKQIWQQRISFFVIDLTAILILSFFAFLFTGKILEPIEQSQREQVRFIAAASHELRTPLTVMLSTLNSLKYADSAQRESFIASMESEGKRMSGLITDMLTLARADNHSWSMHAEKIAPDTLLLNCYEAFQPLAAEKKIALKITLPQEDVACCLADRDRISQVLSILLHNAISYTPEGGRVSLSLCTQHKYVIFEVADNGPGIADSEKEKIFERFYKIDASRNERDHFGLGLSIAMEIMKAHRGGLQVKDTPGGGSTFLAYLPCQ